MAGKKKAKRTTTVAGSGNNKKGNGALTRISSKLNVGEISSLPITNNNMEMRTGLIPSTSSREYTTRTPTKKTGPTAKVGSSKTTASSSIKSSSPRIPLAATGSSSTSAQPSPPTMPVSMSLPLIPSHSKFRKGEEFSTIQPNGFGAGAAKVTRVNSSNGSSDSIPEPNHNGITPAGLVDLMNEAQTATGGKAGADIDIVILLDCRMQKDYSKSRINFTNVVNVPPFMLHRDPSQEFTSKHEVIKLIRQNCPHLLEKLFSPGHYANIVLIEGDKATILAISSVMMLRLALLKWNETTRTNIKVLHGGIVAFSEQFPLYMITSACRNFLPELPDFNPSSAPTIQQKSSKNTKQNDSSEADVSMQELQEHVTNVVERASNIMETLISLNRKCRSFACIESVLSDEHELKLYRHLVSQIPKEAKCPICMIVYSGEVIHCRNGHCICEACAEEITSCQKCRLPYNKARANAGTMKDRIYQKLRANPLRFQCLCGQILELSNDVKNHARICARQKNSTEEIGIIGYKKSEVEVVIEKLDLKLKEVNNLRNLGMLRLAMHKMELKGEDNM